jgi:hypothetical protein
MGGNAGQGPLIITSNTSWTLVSMVSWMTPGTGSGTGNTTTSWFVNTNNSANSRTGTMRLRVGQNVTDFMVLTQQGSYNCIDPETDITLESGHTKKAKDVKTGDVVRTKHETTMEMLSCIVTKAELLNDTKKLRIVYSDRDLICSPGHRVYVDNKSEFIAAKLLEVGDITTGYEILEVVELEDGAVVNLTVEKAHTYISNGILSHNNK